MNPKAPWLSHSCISLKLTTDRSKKGSDQRSVKQIEKMSEPDQELDIINTATAAINSNGKNNPEIFSGDSIDLTLVRLDSFDSSGKTSSTHYHTPCISCGCAGSSIAATNISSSSNKRRCPDFIAPANLDSQDQITRKPKKLFLEPKENTTITIPSLRDFSKITLPCTLPTTENRITNTLPALRRCHSDPYSPPVTGSDSFSGSGTGFAANPFPQSPPESAKIAGTTDLTTPSSKGTASLPPNLKRSLSDPSPNKSFSRSSRSNDMPVEGSYQYEWLRKMRDCMKEMSQWWDEVLPDEAMAEDNSTDNKKADSVTEFEEAVHVERTGDCLIVHFKCPCSKGCKILLSGSDCYYKLL